MLEQLVLLQMLIDVKLFHILVQEILLTPLLKDHLPGVDKLKIRLSTVKKLVKDREIYEPVINPTGKYY